MDSAATVTAYVAIGSNLGDREATIRSALLMLDKVEGVRVGRVSTLFENPSIGGPDDAPAFLNAAAEVTTTLDAASLLRRLLAIERSLGRQRRERWAPRTIDLDLLLFGNSTIDEPHLTVPHPRMHERLFVLKPLAEIAPDAVHPVLRTTASALLEKLTRGM